jgi:hypothetical protein
VHFENSFSQLMTQREGSAKAVDTIKPVKKVSMIVRMTNPFWSSVTTVTFQHQPFG